MAAKVTQTYQQGDKVMLTYIDREALKAQGPHALTDTIDVPMLPLERLVDGGDGGNGGRAATVVANYEEIYPQLNVDGARVRFDDGKSTRRPYTPADRSFADQSGVEIDMAASNFVRR
jgi:hypothetical protein